MSRGPRVSEEELESHRHELRAFCYQMLGSPFDAEDAVQDVFERAWKARESFDPTRSAIRTWLFRIARNVCVDRLRAAPRRPLPRDLGDPGIDVGAPLVPALDVPWLMPAPSGWFAASEVEARVERADAVRLAVTALLQALPARQRAAFILRDLLGLSAAETAGVLRTTAASVSSALQRARETVQAGAPPRAGVDVATASIERYARAIECADADALAALVAEDVLFEMPPVPAWSRDRATYRAFMAHLFARGAAWRARVVPATGQPALLLYRETEHGPQPHTVQLFDVAPDGAIVHVLVYQDPRLFALFEGGSGAER